MSNNVVLPVVRAFVLATKWITTVSRQRVARGSREAVLSASQQRHTPSEDACTNEVDASRTPQKDRTKCAPTSSPTQRTTTPYARSFTAHPDINAKNNTSFKCALTQAVDVGDILLVFPWWRSVVCPSLKRNAPTAPDSAWVTILHSLGPPSSWHALHNLIVLSIGNSCRSFRDARKFCRHTETF